VVILVVVVGAILAYSLIHKGKSGQVKYRTEVIGKGDIEAVVTTSGTLNPVDTVDVGAQVSGKIMKLYADFNSKVTKDQLLAEIDQEPLQLKLDQAESSLKSSQATLDQAKLTLDQMEKKYNRSKELFAKKQISVEDMETAESNYLNAKGSLVSADSHLAQSQSAVDSAKVDLSYATIKSPIDGVVINRAVNLGQTVQSSYQAPTLFKLASDLTKMQVQCDIDETDIGKVKEGQRVRFTVSAYPGETFNGVVQQVRYSPQTVQNVVTYTTIVNAENPDLKLMPGMTATVSVVTATATGVVRIPNSAMRFTPPLPQEELNKIYAANGIPIPGQKSGQQGGQQGVQQRQGSGQSGGQQAGQPSDKQRQSGGQQSGQQRQGGGQGGMRINTDDLTPEQLAKLQQQMASRQPRGGRIWIIDDLGNLKPLFVSTGITDNSYSELTRGEIKEGMKIIIGLETPLTAATPTTQTQIPGQRGAAPGGMMFMGR